MNRFNFAARAARWSAEHWKTAVAVWVAFVAVAIGLGMTVGTHTLSVSEQSTGETARAEQILASAGFKTPASESVLVRSSTRTVADPAFRSTVQSVLVKLRTMPQVTNLRTGAAGQISKDRRAQLIEFDMKGKLDTADARVQPLLDAVAGLQLMRRARQQASPEFTVAEFGFVSKTIDKDFQTPQFAKAYAEFKKRALATGVIHQPIRVSVNKAKTVARVDFPLAGKGQDATAVRALETLRTQVIPPVLATLPPGTQQAVTGDTAANVDFNQTMKSRAPIVFAFVLGFAILLLLLTFRSIVIPIKAIILNLLSVGAAYGVLVWIFQYGHLQGLLGFHSNGAVVTWLPLFLFTVLFGLSMDYHVFILSRVKELVDQGVPTNEAVERGIRSTASTVTSAAAVMIAVFAIFATLSTLDIKQLGVGLAVAVLLDATLIRGVLLPAAMKLLGDWNWYLPRWLEWMPRIGTEPAQPKPGEDIPTTPPVPVA
jgi:uncharacterized membrane protein YdfJ with MMPL/SSD domain